ncbi:MAG: DUF3037 domain-containing protein [Chloroflexi bacterium]|nr:DUF3037 domain-containing protein [Chloroflexota bacterium]
MPDRSSFEYAVVRIVPQVAREEFINAGVILYCRAQRFLAATIGLNQSRLLALAPQVDLALVQAELDLIPTVCAGGPAAGPIGELSQAERFRWLTAPRSTTVQVSPVHAGLCNDPQAALDELFAQMVA